MLDFKQNSNYRGNEERIRDYHATPCIFCGKGVKEPWKNTVHIFWGFTLVTKEEAENLNSNGDLGAWPVGTDCLKKHPEIVPYIIK